MHGLLVKIYNEVRKVGRWSYEYVISTRWICYLVWRVCFGYIRYISSAFYMDAFDLALFCSRN
nr:MAG TPA: hypothetical protein [Caudoviricetes sp.]